ncbi:Putative alpha/Beta hydrolase [Septoria linicola]|uniref:Alpha/Beta hydrolase n=1 Tax=Septoria linicola TaxID=215465 RepID=A0A9Q9AJG1_9PEZI|nr:putative alpha/Beta hydrolase [Septoria linicola]USW47560.1 Putative alpha/Beta hydrolase [Septoria linicola]
MRTSAVFGLLASSLLQVHASPTPTLKDADLQPRQFQPIELAIQNLNNLINQTLANPPTNQLFQRIEEDLQLIKATAAPISVPSAATALKDILVAAPTPSNFFGYVGSLAAAGLSKDNIPDLLEFAKGAVDGENSFTNVNTRKPSIKVFPKADPKDAPFSLSEAALRAAIHIPSSFKYGARGAPNPIILVPGTGATGYTTFVGNYIPLLQGSSIADPVWLNIPGFLLGDAQVHAEYIAYAVNYIHGISNKRKVSVAAWSQGSINGQWAWKHWPSARAKVTDFVTFSGNYAGTINANFLATPGIALPPAVLQQESGSNFIKTLRSNGGDSAYVPTTSVFSGFFDEIVQPQSGTGASAFIKDARRVGSSNTEVQKICPGKPAGSVFTHEGVLYNAIGFALLKDALTHNGPGQVSRIPNLASLCENYLTPGLDLADFLLTENAILIAGLTIVTYPQKVTIEPALKSYARSASGGSSPGGYY